MLLLCLAAYTPAQASPPATGLSRLQFLIGDWKGVGGGKESGQGTGESSIHWDLGHTVIVRRDTTMYPPQNGHAGYTYEAMMVIAQDPATHAVTAEYFDSGAHHIHYDLSLSDYPVVATFISKSDASTPAFRLTYSSSTPNSLSVKFEISPPGQNGKFMPLISGMMTRANSAK